MTRPKSPPTRTTPHARLGTTARALGIIRSYAARFRRAQCPSAYRLPNDRNSSGANRDSPVLCDTAHLNGGTVSWDTKYQRMTGTEFSRSVYRKGLLTATT